MASAAADADGSKRPWLEVVDLVKRYGEETTIGPISFEVHEGEFFSLLGPSGCGKSTTLRAVAGFETADEGEILLRGAPIHHLPPNRRGVGLVFQRHALFPHLNVRDNIWFGLKQHRVPRQIAERRVLDALDLVGLRGFEDRWPAQLSGGQQQRVALARSLVLEPPLFLLDEPLSSLDLKLRVQMREELRNLQKRLKKTMIFVTHDQNEALAMSDRIAVLSNGRIEQIGSPRDIYNRPATRFVADFIGVSNQIPIIGAATRQGRTFALIEGGLELALPEAAAGSLVNATAVVRPESIQLHLGAMPDGLNTFDVRVVDEEYLGDDIQYRVRTNLGLELVVARKASARDTSSLTSCDCHASIDPESIYIIR
jgi:ABC-type Fe3+/spermidine/putrescine transport system ATPase subunit